MSSIFQAVKENVTPQEAARHYGLSFNRYGMALCPFHNDRNPSMKLYDKRYYCFGCGAKGDVIDLVANLRGLGAKDAAGQIAEDFGVLYEKKTPRRIARVEKRKPRERAEREKTAEAKRQFWQAATDYCLTLRRWKTEYAPRAPDEELHPRYVEALQKLPQAEYVLDMFWEADGAEQLRIMEARCPAPVPSRFSDRQAEGNQIDTGILRTVPRKVQNRQWAECARSRFSFFMTGRHPHCLRDGAGLRGIYRCGCRGMDGIRYASENSRDDRGSLDLYVVDSVLQYGTDQFIS